MTPSASAVALDLFVVFLVAVVAPLGVMLCQSRRASKRAVAFGLWQRRSRTSRCSNTRGRENGSWRGRAR